MTMMSKISKSVGVVFVLCGLSACVSPTAQLQQGKQAFYYQHYDEAFKLLLPLAEQGNPEAQYAVGYAYYYGKGVIESPEKGQYWINKSAQQGNPLAIRA